MSLNPLWLDAVLSFVHILCILMMAVFLTAEAVLLRPEMTPAQRQRLRLYDLCYGVSAVLVLCSGAARLLWGAKGMAFYVHNPVFHLKMGVFVLMALCSIPPTLAFFRWHKQGLAVPVFVPGAQEIQSVRRWVMWGAHLMILLPLCAALMARGIGHT